MEILKINSIMNINRAKILKRATVPTVLATTVAGVDSFVKSKTESTKTNFIQDFLTSLNINIDKNDNSEPLERDFNLENKMKLITNTPEEYNRAMRLAELEFDDKKLINIIRNDDLYKKAILLKNKDLYGKDLNPYLEIKNENAFKRAVSLLKEGIHLNKKISEYLYLDTKTFNLCKTLLKQNLDVSQINKILNKRDENKKNDMITNIKMGADYEDAKIISEFNSKEKELFNNLIKKGFSVDNSLAILYLSPSKQKEILSYINKGITEPYIIDVLMLPTAQCRQAKVLIDLGVDPYVAYSLATKGINRKDKSERLNPELIKDLKYIPQLKNNKNFEDIFVKKYSSKEEAISKLSVGETCRLGDSEKVNIKKADETLEELNISAKKYMELFPPIKRFSIAQNQIGDCFLISPLDELYKNPKTRVNILRCFTENEDGSVTVKMPTNDTSFTIEKGKKVKDYVPSSYVDFDGVSTYGNLLITGSEGIKALEYLYGNFAKELDIKYFEQQIKKDVNNLNKITEDYQVNVLKDKILSDIDNRKNKVLSSEGSRDGGFSSIVLKNLGFKNAKLYNGKSYYECDYENGREGIVRFEKFREGLKDLKENFKKKIFLTATKSKFDRVGKNINLFEGHVYELEYIPQKNGKDIYRLSNPHNSSFTFDLTEKEYLKYFEDLYSAEI